MIALPDDDLERVCAYYEAFCGSLHSASILISGVTGFVGSWLLESLATIDREFHLQMSITGITRDGNKARQTFLGFKDSNIKYVEMDICDRSDINGNFSHFLHAATPTTAGTRAGNMKNVYEASVTGAENLIAHARKQGNGPVFVHTSSGAVYGAQPKSLARFPIDWPRQKSVRHGTVRNEYERAKIDTELLVETATTEGIITGINARMFAFMGPRLPLREHYAIGNFVYSGINEDVISIKSDGQSVRSYQHASDMVSQQIFLLSQTESGNFHIGSDDGRSLLDWAELVGAVSNKPVEVLHTDTSIATRYVPASDSRIPEGFGEKISKPEHISRWIKWLRS